MIFTQYGVPVRIIGGDPHGLLVVQGVEMPDFIRQRSRHELKADGGAAEIDQAIASALSNPKEGQ